MHRVLKLSSFQAFQYRGFGALWTGALISNIGTWMSTVALGVAVTQTTGRAAWTAAVAALAFVPAVLLAPVAGALADRFDRRRYLMLLNLGQVGIAITLAVLSASGRLSVGWMGILALLTGCANTLANPAFVALISDLVPPPSLHNALSLNSAQFNLGRIIGPALATIVFAVGGAAWAFALNALSFIAVLWALLALPVIAAPRAERPTLLRGIREGVDVVLGDRGIRLALLGVLATAVLIAPFIGMVPVYALEVFNQGPETASLFTTSQGVGAVIAALWVGPLARRVGLRRMAELAAVAMGPCALAYWAAPRATIAAVCIAALGGAYLMTLSTFNTITQLRAPRGMQARVSSIHSMLLGGGYALGLVCLGPLADRYGLRVVLGSAAFAFTVLVVGVRILMPEASRVLDPALPAPAAPSAAIAPSVPSEPATPAA